MWSNLVEEAIILKNIFKNDIVTLDNVKIRKIEIDCLNGWSFKIHFDLSQFPSHPPLKWVENDYNTAKMSLNLLENEILSFQNTDFSLSVGNMYITEFNNYKQVIFKNQNNNTIFNLKCKWIYIESLTGYNDGEKG